MLEAVRLTVDPVWLGAGRIPRGDGRGVVLLPGFGGGDQTLCHCAFAKDFWAPFPSDHVRLTSIYSKGDGVVRWQAQRVPNADCVEVTGSHVGLVFNRESYRAIASALAAPEL